MNIFELLAGQAAQHQLAFILIGGHAVNIHGASRMTFDIDLLVRRALIEKWRELIETLGFRLLREENNFAQFAGAEKGGSWPLDLMLVNDRTLEKMWDQSKEVKYESVLLRVASVEHLIALKVHALRLSLPHRTIKDFQNVVGLVETNRIDLRSQVIQDISKRTARPSFIGKSKSPAINQLKTTPAKFPENDLDLPTINPIFSRPPRLPFETCVKLCEELLPVELKKPDFETRRLARKNTREFIL